MASIQKDEIVRTFQTLRLSDNWRKIAAMNKGGEEGNEDEETA